MTVVTAWAALSAAGCGSSARQDADEPSGTWRVAVVEASFPKRQRLAERQVMRIKVRNAGDRAIPNIAVTVDAFSRRSDQPGLANPERPVWIVDAGPRGGITAYANTWALGRVPPGATRTFAWRVTPVEAGSHRVSYRVSAGLDGKAKARLAGGRTPDGTFRVRISDEPSQSRVDPDTGRVIRD